MNPQSRIKTVLMAVAASATLLLALPSQAGDYHHERGHDHRYCPPPYGWHGGYRHPHYDRHARYDHHGGRDRRDDRWDGRWDGRRDDRWDDRRHGR